MPWLFLLLALAAFAVALNTSSMVIVVLSLLVALAATLAWVLGLLAQRVGNQSRDEGLVLDPAELRRMREQADARRAAANPDAAGPATAAAAGGSGSTDSA